MAKKTKKKTKKRKQKSTEWGIGQTLDFPKKKNPADINLLAREVGNRRATNREIQIAQEKIKVS